jgi:hypothetical protein
MNFELGNQVLTDPLSSCWQQKFDSVFCAIKFLIFATLAVEAILTFLIWLRLRAAWAGAVEVDEEWMTTKPRR